MRRLLKYAFLSPMVRELCERAGPAYWRLPRDLRRRLVREVDLPKLGGAKCWRYGEAERVRPTPALFPSEPPTFGHRLSGRPYRSPQPFMAELPGAWLVGKHATPVTPRGEVLMTSFRNQPRMAGLESQSDLLTWIRSEGWRNQVDSIDGTEVVPMVSRLDSNYFHWLTEYCTWLEAFDIEGRSKPRLLIRKDGPSFIRESLQLLGFAGQLTEWTEEDARVPRWVSRLFVGSLPKAWGSCSPDRLRWLRRKLRAPCDGADLPANERIYIHRSTQGWRHVVNDDVVSAVMKRYGFSIVRPHKLTLSEQVSLFSRADVVVGMHGAGLTNVMFAHDAALIELIGSYGGGDYYSMCSALGIPYGAVVGRPSGDDIVVDVDELSRAIDLMDSRPRGVGLTKCVKGL